MSVFLYCRHLELHSPDAKHTVVLRAKDPAAAQTWFNTIHGTVTELLPKVTAEVQSQLGKNGISGSHEIRHMGWLAEKVSLSYLLALYCFFFFR